jgi:alanine dehydrogenase
MEAPVLILSRSDVEALLDLDQLVEAVAAAMVALSAGRASMPARCAASVAERHAMLVAMPAYLPSAQALTAKLVSLFPDNQAQPTHQAVICCFDSGNGTPLAVMDGTLITEARTAAGSALATRLLARRTASVVTIVGTGVQARSHAKALDRLPGVQCIRIGGRDAGKVNALVDELAAAGIPAKAASCIEEAVRTADIVCVATHADRPVIKHEWLRPGTHVNSVGYNARGDGEVDTATIRDAVVVVESRDSALASPPSGAVELQRAIERGVIDAAHIHAEIGDIASGRAKGRTNDDQITLYKSVGVAVQDSAAAALILQAAQSRGIGTEIQIA